MKKANNFIFLLAFLILALGAKPARAEILIDGEYTVDQVREITAAQERKVAPPAADVVPIGREIFPQAVQIENGKPKVEDKFALTCIPGTDFNGDGEDDFCHKDGGK